MADSKKQKKDKKSEKKSKNKDKKDSKGNKDKKPKNRQIMITSIIAIIVLAVIVLMVAMGTGEEQKAQYAAKVNGEKIEMEYVNKIYNGLDPMARAQMTKFDLLNNSIIPDALLYQEVQNSGVIVTEEEVMADINNTLLSAGMTIDDLNSQLEAANTSFEEFKSLTRKRLETLKYVNENFAPPEVSEEEAKSFYDENLDAFRQNLGENVTYGMVAEGIKMGIQMESQQAMVMDYVKDLRSSAKILVNNDLLQS